MPRAKNLLALFTRISEGRMSPFLPVLSLILAFGPHTTEAVSRAASLEATQNPRFDVVSELDSEDLANLEAARQQCGSEESCASLLAGAYDSRLVIFINLYTVGADAHAQITFRDLKTDTIVHRADAVGPNEQALFNSVRNEVRDSLARFSDFPSEGRVRLFVGRAAGRLSLQPVEGTPDDSQGTMVFGAVLAGSGTIISAAGLAVGLFANAAIVDPNTLRAEKDASQYLRTGGYVAAGGGLVVLGIGAAMLVVSMLDGDSHED